MSSLSETKQVMIKSLFMDYISQSCYLLIKHCNTNVDFLTFQVYYFSYNSYITYSDFDIDELVPPMLVSP